MTQSPAHTPSAAELRQEVARLADVVRLMELDRTREIQRRRRRLLIVGGSLSLLLHLGLMIFLGTLPRAGYGDGDVATQATYEFAILNSEELSDELGASFDDLQTQEVASETAITADLTAISPDISVTAASTPTLLAGPAATDESGGSGGAFGEGLGLGGGGGASGTTSFFGIGSKGSKFAFIVDVSGSMGQSGKLDIAMRELARSVSALPDYASFYVLLFSSSFVEPPSQRGWQRARKPLVRDLVRWLQNVEPTGGTEPRSSFLQVFALEERPDVVFFLTDGQFTDITAEEIAALNARGKRAIINTIQFGDPDGQDLLRKIAADSGGLYRFVPAGGP